MRGDLQQHRTGTSQDGWEVLRNVERSEGRGGKRDGEGVVEIEVSPM